MWALASLRLLPPLLMLLLVLSTTNAAVIPFNNNNNRAGSFSPSSSSSSHGMMCRPKLSGLVQQIRKSGDPQVMWRSVATARSPAGTITDGVQAVRLPPRSNSADSDLAYEWFIEATAEPGVYSIASATAPEPCSDSPGTSARSRQGQHAFFEEADIGEGVTPRPDCVPAHLFRIVCQSCEPHEDSAWGCLIQSVFNDRCVDLVLPDSANLPPPPRRKLNNQGEAFDTGSTGRPHLGWADCSSLDSLHGGGGGGRDKLPWTRSGKRDQPDAARKQLQRQLWDIAP